MEVVRPRLRRAEITASELRDLWSRHLADRGAVCPQCVQRALGMSVAETPRSYRLQCAGCGWQSAWFEVISYRKIELVPFFF